MRRPRPASRACGARSARAGADGEHRDRGTGRCCSTGERAEDRSGRPPSAGPRRAARTRVWAWLLSVAVLVAVVALEVVLLRDDIAADVHLLLEAGRSGSAASAVPEPGRPSRRPARATGGRSRGGDRRAPAHRLHARGAVHRARAVAAGPGRRSANCELAVRADGPLHGRHGLGIRRIGHGAGRVAARGCRGHRSAAGVRRGRGERGDGATCRRGGTAGPPRLVYVRVSRARDPRCRSLDRPYRLRRGPAGADGPGRSAVTAGVPPSTCSPWRRRSRWSGSGWRTSPSRAPRSWRSGRP